MISNQKKWQIVLSNYLIKNKWLTVRKDKVILPSGVEIDDYYVLEYPDWVTVIAITAEGKYVMERQYRHGIQKTCYELCGGTVEKGENIHPALKAQGTIVIKGLGVRLLFVARPTKL